MSKTIDLANESFDCESPFTVVVLGPPRSGTSMTAGLIRLLGIHMGQCNESNNEDPRFNKKNDIESIRQLVVSNNDGYRVWGWKEPSTHMYFDQISDMVRAPYFVVNYRNILASVSSKLKHTGEGDPDQLAASYANHYLRISRLLASSTAPKIYVNYEKVLGDPVGFADILSCRFLGKSLDPEMHDRITRYCAPGEYKSMRKFA